MIGLEALQALLREDENHLPLLTLEEFFEGNQEEDAIAPNQLFEGRPSLAEIYGAMQRVEALEGVAWVRATLHDDTVDIGMTEDDLTLYGESILICTTIEADELAEIVDCRRLCSDGVVPCEVEDLECLYSRMPPVPEGFQCLEIVWD